MEERIQKIIAKYTNHSRRHAEELICEGVVKLNGRLLSKADLGLQIDPDKSNIFIHNKKIITDAENQMHVVVALYKPIHVMSTLHDPGDRACIKDIVPVDAFSPTLFNIGRLDFETEGLLLMTNHGQLAQKVGHPTKELPKKYAVKIKGKAEEKILDYLRRGVRLEDGSRTKPCQIRATKEGLKNSWYEVILTEGKNRQIRNMFKKFNLWVIKLKRVAVGPITLNKVEVGNFRLLTIKEIHSLCDTVGLPYKSGQWVEDIGKGFKYLSERNIVKHKRSVKTTKDSGGRAF